MALDNDKDTRRPHSAVKQDTDKKADERSVSYRTNERITADMGNDQKVHEGVTGERRNPYLTQYAKERTEQRSSASVPPTLPSKSVVTLNSSPDAERENQFERRMREKKKKKRRNRLIAMVLVEMVTLAVIFGFGFVYRYMNMTQSVSFDVSKVRNENIDITKKQKMEGSWTVVVFGVDSRDGGVGKGANADVQIIVNVDMGTGDVKLVSVYRDTYLRVNDKSRYAKINEAYAAGGPERAVWALNTNLDLDIENYMTFNWKAVADAITLLGGVDIDITDKEFYYMNAYIHETCIKSGISPKNPAAYYIEKAGPQHLNGVQAVAYARLRYMDNDFERTRRQREVIAQCLQKAKQADLATLTSIIDTVLPQVAFNIDTADIIEIAKGIGRYNIVDAEGFPQKLTTQMMGKKGDCVIPITLSSNVVQLHKFLFGEEDYDPTTAVKQYSQKISDDSGYYANYKETESEKETSKTKSTKEVEAETDENGKKKTTEAETDENGKKKTTEAETDENGKKKTTEAETDEDGRKKTTEAETDENGNTIRRGDDSAIEETDENGNIIMGETERSQRPGDEPEEGPGEDAEEEQLSRPGDSRPGGDHPGDSVQEEEDEEFAPGGPGSQQEAPGRGSSEDDGFSNNGPGSQQEDDGEIVIGGPM